MYCLAIKTEIRLRYGAQTLVFIFQRSRVRSRFPKEICLVFANNLRYGRTSTLAQTMFAVTRGAQSLLFRNVMCA
jgi:hypothetical protein